MIIKQYESDEDPAPELTIFQKVGRRLHHPLRRDEETGDGRSIMMKLFNKKNDE